MTKKKKAQAPVAEAPEIPQPGPDLKFAVGIRKGTPLDAVGMSYKIILHGSEYVAKFANGAQAKFYKEATPAVPAPPVVEREEPDLPASWGSMEARVQPLERVQPTLAPVPHTFLDRLHDKFYLKQRNRTRYAQNICAFRSVDGSRPKYPLEPVYCIMSNGVVQYTFNRTAVGDGLREYIWLYERLRELRRGVLAAVVEARAIYFL